jgi:hypothetical protein
MIDEILEDLKDTALTGDQVLQLVDNKANIIKYNELANYDNLLDVLHPYGSCIILYETKMNYGHWVCVIQREDVIEHFDSYGLMPDDELKFVPKVFRMENNMALPHLTYLLIHLPKNFKIEFNEYKLQEKKNNIKTCGRWVASRINNKNISIDKFAKYFLDNHELKPDDIVVLNTI